MDFVRISFCLVTTITVACLPSTHDDTVQRTSDLNHAQVEAITGAVYRTSHTCSASEVNFPNRSLEKKGTVAALLFSTSIPTSIFESVQVGERDGVVLGQYYGDLTKRVVSFFPAQATFNEDTGEFRVDTTEPHNSVLSISGRARVQNGERGALATVTEQTAWPIGGSPHTHTRSEVLILEDPETWYARHKALYSCAQEVLKELKP